MVLMESASIDSCVDVVKADGRVSGATLKLVGAETRGNARRGETQRAEKAKSAKVGSAPTFALCTLLRGYTSSATPLPQRPLFDADGKPNDSADCRLRRAIVVLQIKPHIGRQAERNLLRDAAPVPELAENCDL